MGEINLLAGYPKSRRPIDERGRAITEGHREKARQFGEEYFDGDRLYGYGGFYYNPRFWRGVVKDLLSHYEGVTSVLDVGCAKGYMLYDFKQTNACPNMAGIDISEYAIEQSFPDIRKFLRVGNAKDLPYPDDSFDLVVSVNTIHNLPLGDCERSIREIGRVSRKHSFITVDAWRNKEEEEKQWE